MKGQYVAMAGAVVIGGGLLMWGFFHPAQTPDGGTFTFFAASSTATTPASTGMPASTPTTQGKTFSAKSGITTNYVDDHHNFSFELPSGFTATPHPTDVVGAEAIIVANGTGDALLLVVRPAAKVINSLSSADVVQENPKIGITESVSISVAPGIKGLAFAGTDPSVGRPASELWFVYRGNWYELSTSAEDANLLTFIWNSWQWR